MTLPDGTWLAGGSEIPYPQLQPEEVKVFLAEDGEWKREAILDSLTGFGLNHDLTIAKTYSEAEEFIRAQERGNLAANVFLFDGELDTSHPGGQRQGDALLQILFRKYVDPLMTCVIAAGDKLKREGLVRRQVDEIINQDAVSRVASQILRKEALVVGISRTDKGELSSPAQVPRAHFLTIGHVVFELAVPEATRNKIAKQRRREADRERSRIDQ